MKKVTFSGFHSNKMGSPKVRGPDGPSKAALTGTKVIVVRCRVYRVSFGCTQAQNDPDLVTNFDKVGHFLAVFDPKVSLFT